MEKKPKIIIVMTTKKIVGIGIFSIGIGALVYIYKGYYVPKKEVEAMTPEQIKKEAILKKLTTPKV
jgi:hypothetical protein